MTARRGTEAPAAGTASCVDVDARVPAGGAAPGLDSRNRRASRTAQRAQREASEHG